MPGYLLASYLPRERLRPRAGDFSGVVASRQYCSFGHPSKASMSLMTPLGSHFAAGHVWGQLLSLVSRATLGRWGSSKQEECVSSLNDHVGEQPGPGQHSRLCLGSWAGGMSLSSLAPAPAPPLPLPSMVPPSPPLASFPVSIPTFPDSPSSLLHAPSFPG